MVVAEGEMKSPLQSEQTPKNQALSSLGRQSSIYSLTLDEFQHTLCEGGKNFGSMNMDEFLSSIWNAEENQAINTSNQNTNVNSHFGLDEASGDKGIRKQPSLPRQGSLTIPAPLSRKTVDEVWSEIHKGRHNQSGNNNEGASNDGNAENAESAPRQPTFGEMTLEDFLVKAGVVRESCPVPAPAAQQQQYGMYPNNKSAVGPTFVGRPVIGNVVAAYQGEPSGYAGNGKRDSGYPPPPPPPAGVCYGGGGYGAAPVSPVSSDGLGANENCGGQFGVEMGVLRGRKRIIDGPVEKVVERRQRRMIKNRESAARSRARKQVRAFFNKCSGYKH